MVNLLVFKSLLLRESNLFVYQVRSKYELMINHLRMLVIAFPSFNHFRKAFEYSVSTTFSNLPADVRTVDVYCTFNYKMRRYVCDGASPYTCFNWLLSELNFGRLFKTISTIN